THRIGVPGACHSELVGRRLCAVGVARADDDLVAPDLRQALRQRAPERARAADDRDPHLSATAASAASATARRGDAPPMRVFVTIVLTPASLSASASSMTSASIRPA